MAPKTTIMSLTHGIGANMLTTRRLMSDMSVS